MRGHSSVLVALALGGCLVLAQVVWAAQQTTRTTVLPSAVCPMGVSGVPMTSYVVPMSTSTTPMYLSSACPMGMTGIPMTSYMTPMYLSSAYSTGMTYPTGAMYSTGTTYPSTMSADTAAILNEIRSLRAEIRATSLEMRGQALVSRMNQLTADEMAFRQSIAANPNQPDARMQAAQLQAQANVLYNDIAAFQRELSLVPVEERPFLASRLSTFETVYWQPSVQQFVQYSTQFQQQASTAYQPAITVNPWLTSWQTSYQASLNNINTLPTTYASVRWWSTPVVLGSVETFQGGMVVMPSGTVMYIPPSAFLTPTMTASAMGTTVVVPGSAITRINNTYL